MANLFTKKSFSVIEITVVILFVIGMMGVYVSNWMATKTLVQEVTLADVTLAEEAPINTNLYKQNYTLTKDWFHMHTWVWQAALKQFVGKPDIQYLEIGLFEGGSALWMLENVLTHPTSHLTGIDPFSETRSLEANFPSYPKLFFSNLELSGVQDRTTIITGFSQIEMHKLPLDHYDIIYIDGSHTYPDALEDAMLAMRLLKEGGVMILDDYNGMSEVASAFNNFYYAYGDKFEVLHNGYQLILQKKT